MNKKLYDLMNWADIEEIVYGEAMHPEKLLGAHNVGRSTLIQAYFPGAKSVSLYIEGSDGPKGKTVKDEVKMDMADEAGFFAALLPGKNRKDYYYHVQYPNKDRKVRNVKEAYIEYPVHKEEELENVLSGSDYYMQNTFGAIRKTVNNVRGVLFTVWAPNALRVSVIGDFNAWNGLENQMVKNDLTGIFELFIPGVENGDKYKYEILLKGNEKRVKCDPFTNKSEGEMGNASVVYVSSNFKWEDSKWLEKRSLTDRDNEPICIYEMCQMTAFEENNIKCNTQSIINHMKEYGYTHALLMPIMEYYNECAGYKPSMFFALDHRIGSENDLKYFINEMHKADLGVFFEWSGFEFDEGESGMSNFDGTCLFENGDCSRGVDARNGAKIFNYGNAISESFILSSLIKLLNDYHFDGIKFTDLSSQLYLDYYRAPGEWTPNIFGSNENLEFVSFVKNMNKIIHKQFPGIISIASEESGWPLLSRTNGRNEEENQNCLGFDFCENKGFNFDVLGYMNCDPIERHNHHNELIASTLYQYSENYILSITHSDVDFGKGGIINRMPGDDNLKYANLRAFYGYLFTHPGKKQIFMGQDFASAQSFDVCSLLDHSCDDNQKKFVDYFKALTQLYRSEKSLHYFDYDEKGFGWINNYSAEDNVIAFYRRDESDTLIVAINFANYTYEKYIIGVPEYAKYKEIFNSDSENFGGKGYINSRLIPSKEGDTDSFRQSITIKLAPLSVSIFKLIPYTKNELEEMKKKRDEKERAAKEKQRKKEALAKEKAKIRASLKEELERKIRDAERAIEEGSEYKK